MDAFEYLSLAIPAGTDAVAALSERGAEGWELVAIRGGCPPDVDLYYLKRARSARKDH